MRTNNNDEETVTIEVKEKIVTPVFLLLCISLLMAATAVILQQVQYSEVRKINANTNEVVKDIERRNSPGAIEAQERQIAIILDNIECDQRKIVQEAFESLENIGLIPIDAVDLVEDHCAQQGD